MSRYFAEALASLYTRTGSGKGTRVRFITGISAEQLADKMDETTAMSPARISRILDGNGLFMPEQLPVFCDILKLSENQRLVLRDALLKDYGERIGFNLTASSDPHIVNILVRDIDLLRTAIEDGQWGYALTLLGNLGQAEQELTANNDSSAPLLRITVMTELERELLMHALSQQGERLEVTLSLPDDEGQRDRIAQAIAEAELSEEAKQVAQWRYLEGRDVEEIADRVEMTDEATLAWLDEIHGVLLQRLAREPEGGLGG